MPCQWIYFIALLLLLVFRISVVDTTWLAQWMWYNGQPESYYGLLALRDNPAFLEFVGGWPLPVFVITIFLYWTTDDNGKDINKQFLLLPFFYLPFSILGNVLQNRALDFSKFITHPLVIVPSGYLYVFLWVLFVWVFAKLKLVVTDES